MTGADYQPLDLSAYRNAPADLLADSLLGRQTFQGLPFEIGDADKAFILLDGATSLTIPVGRQAHTVLFAHRLLDQREVGTPVAEYVIRLADGSEHRTVVRARFEIAGSLDWGQLPFLAQSDTAHALKDRWRGEWASAGYRQTESIPGWPRAYLLWCWRNPAPTSDVAGIELLGRDARVALAAITLGLVDEDPLSHTGAVPVRIELKDESLAHKPLENIAVQIDRGVAGYVYPLPSASADEFQGDPFAGWGEASNGTSSPVYADVAAIPSATLSVRDGDDHLATVPWQDLLKKPVETERVRVAIVEDGRNWVETVVIDDATGQPVPCRVHFRSPEGVPYQPHGHHHQVNSNLDSWHRDVGGDLRLGQITYAYIDGRCQGWLPRGEVLVDIARGYEYQPLRTRVTIAPGQRRLELRLRRLVDMNQQRWFSGDTHVHFLSTQGSLREARAEDLNVVNLLQSQWGSLFTNTEDFIGEPVSSRDGRTVVWANQENRQHLLGHLILLGLKEAVYPWCSDGPSEAELGSTLETTLSHWADACHAQGGTVILPHFPNPNGEPATMIATGRVDAVEMIVHDPSNHAEYYRYLNSGYRLPLVGGTDKMDSAVAVGQYRTYVYISPDEDFSYASWCRNLTAGRTFLSGGPLLELSVDGARIGDTVQLAASGGSVEVVAHARSILPIHCLQLVHNGEVIAQSDAAAGARELSLRERVRITANGWLCARVSGPSYTPISHHDTWRRGVFAHTSPIYVACGDEWRMADRGGLQYLLTLVEGGLAYVRGQAPRRPAGQVTHHHGEDDHQAYLERPFLEAQAALHERLHALAPDAR